jgi:hypothetical protein
MKIQLKGGTSKDIVEIQAESQAVLDIITNTGSPQMLPAVGEALGLVYKL